MRILYKDGTIAIEDLSGVKTRLLLLKLKEAGERFRVKTPIVRLQSKKAANILNEILAS